MRMDNEKFLVPDMGRGTKETFEAPTGIEPMTSWTLGGALSTELREHMKSKVIFKYISVALIT